MAVAKGRRTGRQRIRDEDEDEDEAPDVGDDPALPVRVPGFDGVAALRWEMSSMLTRNPGLVIGLRDSVVEWGGQGPAPEALVEIVRAGIVEGCTRAEITRLLQSRQWLGPDFALSRSLWAELSAQADPMSARAEVVMEGSVVNPANRAGLLSRAFMSALVDAENGPREYRDGAVQSLIALAQQLRVDGVLLEATASRGKRPSASAPGSGPAGASGVLSDTLLELVRAARLNRSRADAEAEDAQAS